ncbi:SdpI family protein [Microbacterium sp. kSW2-24]|uniref:SdpI family protein n=1 Tax=Microbacterium galbinum TaxID=2851646 RepID=UPI002D7B9FE2|nr:SdpI family protein [Microbacterium galbinum]
MEVIAGVFPVLLLVTGIVVELAARGDLRRNRLAGIRTVATMRSDASWTASHRSASASVWVGFAASVIAAVVSFASSGIVTTIGAIAVVVIFVLTTVIALVVANRAGRASTSP